MAKFNRLEVFAKVAETGLIPVFYHADLEICKGVLEACYNGGVRVFEFTNRGDYAHELFSALTKYVTDKFPEMILGVGTVFDTGTASLYIQSGANFVVSPVLKHDLAVTCNRRKIAWIPGCATVSEISNAEEWGAEMVKVFPGNVVSPEFISALKGPMPWTSVIVTGGVEPEEENLRKWFNAGVSCVGIGSQLFPKQALQNKDFKIVEANVSKAIDLIKRIRQK